jgi:hypothetical protein
MGHRYWFEFYGGAGDILQTYYCVGGMRKLAALKARDPDCFVRLILYNANSSADDFFRWHPHVNEVLARPFRAVVGPDRPTEDRAGCIDLGHAETRFPDLGDADPKVWLDPGEEEFVRDFAAAGPYAVIQPAAASADRSLARWMPAARAAGLAREAGLRVAVLGGAMVLRDSGRVLQAEPAGPLPAGCEDFTNRLSLRAAVALAQRSAGMFGSFSCFTCAAASTGRPVLATAAALYRPFVEGHRPENSLIGRMRLWYDVGSPGLHESARDFFLEIARG